MACWLPTEWQRQEFQISWCFNVCAVVQSKTLTKTCPDMIHRPDDASCWNATWHTSLHSKLDEIYLLAWETDLTMQAVETQHDTLVCTADQIYLLAWERQRSDWWQCQRPKSSLVGWCLDPLSGASTEAVCSHLWCQPTAVWSARQQKVIKKWTRWDQVQTWGTWQRPLSSFQSRNVYFNSETSSLHWKSDLRNVWGQQKRVSTLWRCFRCPHLAWAACYTPVRHAGNKAYMLPRFLGFGRVNF